ncbi:MAG: hypothetical protein RMM31_04720 [Anaerolineae bacterium]|nr:hypothetical protein [Thermoflexales bacterium]MDW8395530.1 hypothetical protein [Anaerolineae bacterium]
MRTPDGRECSFYYADYYRGKTTQECRLIGRNPEGGRWRPHLCKTCRVPEILRHNGCEHLALEGRVVRSFFGLVERVEVYAICTKHMKEVTNPEVGCGECHGAIADLLRSIE